MRSSYVTSGQANSIAPGKRPLCNMLPVILAENGRPFIAGGASGGRHILASVFQLMTYIADFGMDVETAARQLGISKVALKVRAHRGYERLRRILGGTEGME